jgi:AraC-like DNA-binding protein
MDILPPVLHLLTRMSGTATFWHRYLPVDDDTRGKALYVIGCGSAQVPAGHPYPPTQHPSDHHFTWRQGRILREHQLVHITRGGGWFESHVTGRRRIRAGQVIALFPDVWHRYVPNRNSGWDEHWLAFAGREAAVMMAEHGFHPERAVREPGISPALAEIYRRIQDELRLERIGCRPLAAAWTVELMARVEAQEMRRDFADDAVAEAIRRARAAMMGRTDGPVDVVGLARELHVGYSWFRRKFKEYTGFSPAQYHLQLRVHRASELLRDTRMPIGEIAVRTGFESIYYFSRVFRVKTGQAPTVFRERSHGGGMPGEHRTPNIEHRTSSVERRGKAPG